MKQNLDPRLAIGIIAVVALLAIGLLWQNYAGSAARNGPPVTHPAGGGARARVEEMRQAHQDR